MGIAIPSRFVIWILATIRIREWIEMRGPP